MASQRKSCKSNKELQDKYWRELPPTKHRFFTIMLHNFMQEMIIPKKFTENFKEELSPFCTLIGPSKNKWIVKKSTRENNSVAFTDGWGKFVIDHELELCDFLVFRYVGDSSFKVVIFSVSACERESCYFTTHIGSSSLENSSRTTSTEKEVGRSKLPSISDSEDSTVGENEGEDPLWVSEEDSENSIRRKNKSEGKRRSARAKISQICHISKRRKLKPEEKLRSLRMARDHLRSINQSVHPAFLIILLATNVYRGFQLTIPKKWAKKHMLQESHDVELRVPKEEGRSWIVGCRWNTTSDQCHLRAQWRIFVLENNLEMDDTCVFELIQIGKSNKKVKPVFMVHIYRAIDTCVPLTEARKLV